MFFYTHMSLSSCLCVFLGGGLGSLLRFLCSQLIPTPHILGKFPLQTFFVNMLGCLIIGLLASFFANHDVRDSLRNFFIAGLCGGFTTFSTFSRESFSLIQSSDISIAILYIALSLILGILFVAIGFFFSQRLLCS